MQTVNLSANEVLQHLNLELPARWTKEANEIDVVCVNTPDFELGFIVTLNMCPCKGNSFTVHEFAQSLETGHDHEETRDFLTYNEVLKHLDERIDAYKGDI